MPGTQRQHQPCLAGESRNSVFRGLTDREDREGAYTHAIWRARVPSTRARSYLVIYGVVIRFWLACGRSPEGRISTFSWPSWVPREKARKVSGSMFWVEGEDAGDNGDNHRRHHHLLRSGTHAATGSDASFSPHDDVTWWG